MRIHSLIVGQGLAGTLLAHQLLKRGKKVLVLDAPKDNSSSKVAAGLFNPVTGHRMVKTWQADLLFPSLQSIYSELEKLLSCSFLHKMGIFRPFDSIASQNEWFAKSMEPAYTSFVKVNANTEELTPHYSFPYGGLTTLFSGYVDIPKMMESFRTYLKERDSLIETDVSYDQLHITHDSVRYMEWEAENIVFCEGAYGRSNPFFDYLPLQGTKGEILDISIEKYQIDKIINKGIFVIPKQNRQTVGSNYEWNYSDDKPSALGEDEITAKLEKLLQSPYQILQHRAGIRPTVQDHRPLLGRHPSFANVYIFNGMGTKGVSMAPFFSDHMAEFITEGRNLMSEADIKRFDYLYQSK